MSKDYYSIFCNSTVTQDIVEEQREVLEKREMELSEKWYNADGSKKPNWWLKYATPTLVGDTGEETVRSSFDHILNL
jgi:hypothetical protein